jgi:Response regulator containing a CheY-like receiver domain and an HD-GYP domain
MIREGAFVDIVMNTPAKPKPKVMVVDDSATNLTVAKNALSSVYNVLPVASGEMALKLLAKSMPSLILLDIDMPGMDGFETIKRIKSDESISHIPVIFLTAMDDSASELEGLKLGAVDYIKKPFSTPLLIQRVALHIALIDQKKELQSYNENLAKKVREKTKTIEELQHAIIHALSDLIECRDGLTGGHVARTQRYLKLLVDGMLQTKIYEDELAGCDLDLMIESAQLHDIGKVGIPDEILKKPGRLTKEEFEIIKEHPSIGANALKGAMDMTSNKEFLSYAVAVVISHHEKWDGTGYPHGIKEKEIPLIGRLMAIADVYDALVSERPYKKAFSHDAAVDIIVNEAGKHFDPMLIEVFKQQEALFHLLSSA